MTLQSRGVQRNNGTLSSRRVEFRLNASLKRYLRAFLGAKGATGLILILLLTVAALLAPVLFPGGYDRQTRDSLLAPSGAHPFGTDQLGRDIFVRALFGLRTDLSLIYVAVPVSMIIGTMFGLIGAVSSRLGTVVQRVLDIILGFPGLVLGICIVLVLGAGWPALLIAIIIAGLPFFGRLARAMLLVQQEREYVLAARTIGVGPWRVMIRHVLPYALDPILVQGAVFVVTAIVIEASLSIVGLGIQAPQPSLGELLNTGMLYVNQLPAYVLGPTFILFFLALGFTLVADALNETVNRK